MQGCDDSNPLYYQNEPYKKKKKKQSMYKQDLLIEESLIIKHIQRKTANNNTFIKKYCTKIAAQLSLKSQPSQLSVTEGRFIWFAN